VLVDGFVAGTWSLTGRRGPDPRLLVRPVRRLPVRALASVRAEGRRLARFAAAGTPPEVVIEQP
jgi:hypothetical protein